MKKITLFYCALLILPFWSLGQSVGTGLPLKINKNDQYLFYLHGAVVTILGNNAINQGAPEWGPYEYLTILDSLSQCGFHVISENRKEGVEGNVYVHKIVAQLDTLFKAGVKPKNILLVGASAGWGIVLHVADQLKNNKMNYVLMGGCWVETYKEYEKLKLYGQFLSVIESSDPHGTCVKIFEGRKYIRSFKEIKLNTGLSHGFFYKGRKVWIDPIINWFRGNKVI